jgi:hypothetical protein
MIFDDHDVHDDWNTSLSWQQEIRAEDWWEEHIVCALSSYWVYQHIGNLSPAELAADELFSRVQQERDAGDLLRDFAQTADREPEEVSWSYFHDFGRTRLVVVDSRAARVLDPDRRSMLDEQEWAWLEETVTGDFDHLLIATSLPVFLTPGMHDFEAWSEATSEGAWGRVGMKLGEWARQTSDLEHWAAFDRSFDRIGALLEDVAAGRRGPAPASIVLMSGDVHHAYLAEVAFRKSAETTSAVFQAVCSPIRNGLNRKERAVIRFACSRGGRALGFMLAKAARVPDPHMRWRLAERQPWFENQIAQVELEGRSAKVLFERASSKDPADPQLAVGHERELTQ